MGETERPANCPICPACPDRRSDRATDEAERLWAEGACAAVRLGESGCGSQIVPGRRGVARRALHRILRGAKRTSKVGRALFSQAA